MDEFCKFCPKMIGGNHETLCQHLAFLFWKFMQVMVNPTNQPDVRL